MAGDVEDALTDFQILSRITNQTNAEARLFELLVAALCEDCSDLRFGDLGTAATVIFFLRSVRRARPVR